MLDADLNVARIGLSAEGGGDGGSWCAEIELWDSMGRHERVRRSVTVDAGSGRAVGSKVSVGIGVEEMRSTCTHRRGGDYIMYEPLLQTVAGHTV